MEKLLQSIEENRDSFISYTITRLRELLRYLPQQKYDLFHIIPFYLHINTPDFPGYVESRDAACGIFRFEHSGFYRYALRAYDLSHDTVAPMTRKNPVILGLYLMGSAGTLTQTQSSDFDYWVIIRENAMTPVQIKTLDTKLKRIETWCRRRHHQEVTFFMMDIEKLRQNEFSTVDGESSGSAQRTILKDEFYRTFIMIAGKIPLWAVLPPDVNHKDLDQLNSSGMLDNTYIDTGYLSGIDTDECLGAVLWQIYKARKDPVKALIKSSLCAYYAFNSELNDLASSTVKRSFARALIDDYVHDPYAVVFDKIMEFYESIDDTDGLELIRQCIYLRLLSYPLMIIPDEDSPKGKLLNRFINRWKPDRETLIILRNFEDLSEEEKIEFEDRIFGKLSFIYEMILRNCDDNPALSMKKTDLSILKNRTAAFLQKKPGKLPRCSTYLQRKKSMSLEITRSPVQGTWSVSDVSSMAQKTLKKTVFNGPEYLKSMGWIYSNNLDVIRILPESRLTNEIKTFLDAISPMPDSVFNHPPHNEKFLILTTSPDAKGLPGSADILRINSWGEFFFDTLDLSGIESMDEKWYKIKERIDNYQVKSPVLRLQFLVCQSETVQQQDIPDYLKYKPVVTKDSLQLKARSTGESGKGPRTTFKPFLDKL